MSLQPTRRIAVVVPGYGLPGGAEGFAAELTKRVALEPRFDVHLFANRWEAASDRVTGHRVPRVRFPRFAGPPGFAWLSGRAVAAAGPFDIVHTHDRVFRADLYTMHGVPHRYWIREVRRKRMSLHDRALAWLEDRLVLAGGCRRFLAVSGLAREIFLRQYPVDPARVSVVHPGVDASAFATPAREASRRRIRSRFGFALDLPVILFVSMNFAIKGLDRLLDGLGRLRAICPGTRFGLLVVGGDERARFERQAAKLGIAEEVRFAGAVRREALPEFYRAADLYAMLSRFDTFGMVVLEAMAAGLPVLLSDTVGARDVVRDGENGFVVAKSADADRVAARLCEMLGEDLRQRMGREALATARKHSWERVTGRVLSLYDEIREERQESPAAGGG